MACSTVMPSAIEKHYAHVGKDQSGRMFEAAAMAVA
jgi:hypothetical protein